MPVVLPFYACERIRPPSQPSEEEVRQKFRSNLFRQRRAELNQQLMTALGAQVNVAPERDPMLIVDDYRLPQGWMKPADPSAPARPQPPRPQNERQPMATASGMGTASGHG